MKAVEWFHEHAAALGIPIKYINPYFLLIVFFAFMYLRMCTNDSNLEGNKFFEAEEFAEALKHYNEYLLLYPDNVKTLYNRGRCLEVLGKTEESVRDYERVLKLDPDNFKAILSLSQYHYNKEDYEAALLFCSYAVNLDEESALAHYYKARAHHKLGQFNDALDEYNKVIDLDPEYGFAYFQRSSLMFSIGVYAYGCYDLRMADSLNVEGANQALKKFCR